MNILKFCRNPGRYVTKLKYYLAGMYFDYVQKDYRLCDCSFAVPYEYTSRVDRGYFAFGAYEETEVNLLGKVIDPDSAVLELGGCIGVVACLSNKYLTDPAKHVVVEANNNLIPYLVLNRERNGCQFKVENCVVSHEAQVEFFIGKSMVLGSTFDSGGIRVACKGLTFYALEEKYGVRFDTIIMDIEGGEYEVIIRNTGYLSQIKSILMENHPGIVGSAKLKEYEGILNRVGFRKMSEVGSVALWRQVGPTATIK